MAMISGHSPPYFNINFLSFFNGFCVWLVVFLFVLDFFQKASKISERSWLKRLALYFFKDYFLPENKEQPL